MVPLMRMKWITKERPGYFGKRRDEKFEEYDRVYGKGQWRIAWRWLERTIDFPFACQIYEDAYFADSVKREDVWQALVSTAKDVYDKEESDIRSGFDYASQSSPYTHLQDIAIRRIVARRGWSFKGESNVQIRAHDNYWGNNLSPGKVRFHLPDCIESPHMTGWWDKDTVEDFYQSNKVLQNWTSFYGKNGEEMVNINPANGERWRREIIVLNKKKKEYQMKKAEIESEISDILRLMEIGINGQIGDKAPSITRMYVDVPDITLHLNCIPETLEEEEAELIEGIVKQELESMGLNWLSVEIPCSYFPM